LSDRLKELEQRIKCFNSETISFDEVRNWRKGELDELVSDRVLEEIELSKTIVCDQCPDHCTIEPERRTIPQTGEVVGFHVCREKPDGERQIIKLERFKQWRISKDRLIELGYLDEEEADGMEQVWLDDAPEYLPNSEAIKLTEGKLSLSRLSKLLNPDGAIRHMRRGQRCKVHIADFRDRIKGLGDDMFTEKAFEGYFSGAEATKEAIRHTKEKRGK
jgi:hypothetical protein